MNQEIGISGVQYILIQLPHSNNQDEVAISSSVLMLVSSFNTRDNEWEILEGSKRKRKNFLYPYKTKDEVRHLYFRFSNWARLKECLSSEGSVYEIHVDRGDRSCPGYWVSSEVLSWSPVRVVPQAGVLLLVYGNKCENDQEVLPCLLILPLPLDPGDINIRFSHNIGRICEIIFLGINYQHSSSFSIFTKIHQHHKIWQTDS